MECRKKELLAAYADGELSPAENESVGRHLADCAECRTWLELLRRSYAALEAIEPVEVPTGLAVAVRRRTARRYAAPFYVATGLAAAAAVLIMLTVALHPQKPEAVNVAATPAPIDVPAEVAVVAAADTGALSAEEMAVIENLDVLQELEILEDFDMFAEFESLDDLDKFEIAVAI